MENEVVCTSMKSYVIFDLETTTLPCFGPPKITEISAIAVVRDHIENHDNIQELPRVLNKLTLCIYPQKIIPPVTERLTGLSNPLLEDQSPFNENVFNILSDFIARMPKPLCLIAHNGNCFDFPILQSEIRRIGKKFPDDLWCADSLIAFRYLYSGKSDGQLATGRQVTNSPKDVSFGNKSESVVTDVEFDPELCEALDSIEKDELSQKIGNNSLNSSIKETPVNQCNFELLFDDGFLDSFQTTTEITSLLSSPSSVKQMQKINETTPKRKSRPPKVKKSHSNFASSENGCTPDPAAPLLESKRLRRNAPVKCLADIFSGKKSDRPVSFKLVDIYQYMSKRDPINAHSAEADATMLLHCIIASQERFLDWVDKNSRVFNEVKPSW